MQGFFHHSDFLVHGYPQICISHGNIQKKKQTGKITDQT
jgi:hypothetical protein